MKICIVCEGRGKVKLYNVYYSWVDVTLLSMSFIIPSLVYQIWSYSSCIVTWDLLNWTDQSILIYRFLRLINDIDNALDNIFIIIFVMTKSINKGHKSFDPVLTSKSFHLTQYVLHLEFRSFVFRFTSTNFNILASLCVKQ